MRKLITLMLLFAACKSAPAPLSTDSGTEPLVERVELPPVNTGDDSVCAEAHWTAAMACDDDQCVEAAAGGACVSCVAETQACIDERSSGCAEMCNTCLGPERCAELTNVQVASEHLSAAGDRGYAGRASVVHRVGTRPAGNVHAVTPDDLYLTTLQRQRSGLGRPNEPRPIMLIDREQRVLRRQTTTCPVVTTPKGTWLIEQCDGVTNLYEGRTGFFRRTVEISPELRTWELNFGGERWMLVRQSPYDWTLFDLLKGDEVEVSGIDPMTDATGLAPSPDGTRIAQSGRIKVWDIGDPQNPIYGLEKAFGSVRWIDESTLLVVARDEPVRVVSVPDGRVVREFEHPPAGEGDARIFWNLHVSNAEVFFAASTPRGLKINAGDGIDYDVPLIEGEYELANVTPRQQAVRFRSQDELAAKLSDGSYFVPGIHGAVIWHPDRGLDESKVRGEVLWMNSGGDDEVLIGTSASVVAVKVSTGEVQSLDLPIDFRLIDVRRSQGHLIALGSKLGEKGTEYSGEILLIDGRGKQRVVRHGDDTIAATLDAAGRLHVIDRSGLKSYAAGSFDEVARSSKQAEGVGVLSEGAPPRALPTQGIFSPDGSLALFAPMSGQMHGFMQAQEKREVLPAKLVRTADHKVLRTWPAISCMFAQRSNVYACIEPHKEGQDEDIVVYEGTKEIGAIGASLNLADITGVSDDGTRVLLGNHMFRKTNAMFDIERAEVEPIEFGLAPLTFHSDGRYLSFDGTYLELFDQIPTPTR